MGHLATAAGSRRTLECCVKGSTISLRGDLDFASVKGLRAVFAANPEPETIEMSGVGLVTSAALIEFVALAKRMGRRKIMVLGAQPGVARLFRVLGMDRIFLLTEREGRVTALFRKA
jgi:anti-anti-sigma regulatory factor